MYPLRLQVLYHPRVSIFTVGRAPAGTVDDARSSHLDNRYCSRRQGIALSIIVTLCSAWCMQRCRRAWHDKVMPEGKIMPEGAQRGRSCAPTAGLMLESAAPRPLIEQGRNSRGIHTCSASARPPAAPSVGSLLQECDPFHCGARCSDVVASRGMCLPGEVSNPRARRRAGDEHG